MGTIFKNGETLLFIGDSITDCGRMDDRFKPLGCGYVNMFNDMLLTREPKKNIRIINRGVGGNTSEDLRSRWVDDVIAHRPDWLVIKIGINDINRFLSNQGPVLISPELFESIYTHLMELSKRSLPSCRIVLIDPFYGSSDTTPGSYRAKVAALLPRYCEVVARIASIHLARHLKLHDIFQAKLAIQPAGIYFPLEPVHPASAGHFLIAESLYNELSVPD